jgi:hypothetical protein
MQKKSTTRIMDAILDLSDALDPDHQGDQWPDPIAWDGRPLAEQAYDLLVEADAEAEGGHPTASVQDAARALREAIDATTGEALIGWQQIVLRPASGGSGEWDLEAEGGETWADVDELLNAIRAEIGDIYELGIDELPEGLENISGRIHARKGRIFGALDDGRACYFAVAVVARDARQNQRAE